MAALFRLFTALGFTAAVAIIFAFIIYAVIKQHTSIKNAITDFVEAGLKVISGMKSKKKNSNLQKSNADNRPENRAEIKDNLKKIANWTEEKMTKSIDSGTKFYNEKAPKLKEASKAFVDTLNKPASNPESKQESSTKKVVDDPEKPIK